jgi:hypothetical protein
VNCTQRRITVIRWQVKRLAAIAAERAAQAESIRGSDRFRPLTEAEAEALVGGEFLTNHVGIGVLIIQAKFFERK